MPYVAKILADSVGPNGVRLTTWELTYARFSHSQLLTHRLFSRNSASSRAIPTRKLMRQILRDPALPIFWGKNQSGMQARGELAGWRRWLAMQVWLKFRFVALAAAWTLYGLGLHKQLANRLLEPWMFITVIVTATEWRNWYRLRCHDDAQPEIQWLAQEMRRLHNESVPTRLEAGEWHLPLIHPGDKFEARFGWYKVQKIAVARCARVSYLTHANRRDYDEDVVLHDRLAKSGHWSPFEHVAQAQEENEVRWSGNFQGWTQYRELMDPGFAQVGRDAQVVQAVEA